MSRAERAVAVGMLIVIGVVAFAELRGLARQCANGGRSSDAGGWALMVGIGTVAAVAALVGVRARWWLRMPLALLLGTAFFFVALVWAMLSWVEYCD